MNRLPRWLRVTTLVDAPPTRFRVRAGHAENEGFPLSALVVAGGVGPGRCAPARHRRQVRPHPKRSESYGAQGTPRRWVGWSHVALVPVSPGFNCHLLTLERRSRHHMDLGLRSSFPMLLYPLAWGRVGLRFAPHIYASRVAICIERGREVQARLTAVYPHRASA